MVVRRFTPEGTDRKTPMPIDGVGSRLRTLLDGIQDELLAAATKRRDLATVRGLEDYAEFQSLIGDQGGFVFTGWCGEAECEKKVKDDTKATIRVIPDEEFRSAEAPTRCLCGAPSVCEVVRARAY